ncbi:helix-turn-helix domain-containing protein [Marinobacter nauticus]|uniref:helix-turn-helix domain-containing protein n=1 Tax=Marinobacter nauticus TaxID=2743 RepID=UPI000F1468D4|nr:helix-turn-helix transcriptional regulator [Marinobacter nauticus]RKR79212.1 regulatory LuxR family protein [Marinobacter nauticus]
MTRKLKPNYPRMEVELAEQESLPPRRAEVVMLAARGMSAKEIARELSISPETVNWHLDEAKDQFHAHSRVDLICQMWMHGILQARVMSCVLVCFLCILSTFPMARTSRPNQNNRQVVSVVRIGRKEVAAIIGGLH